MRDTREDIKDETGLYRLSFSQLLEQLDAYLKEHKDTGILYLLQKSEYTLKPSASIGVASARYLRLLYDLKIFAKGLLLMDSRSTQHTSIQDGRLLRVYRDWNSQRESSNFVELPLFGLSEFYTGLQLADYVVYLIDRSSKEAGTASGNAELKEAFNLLEPKMQLVKIPIVQQKIHFEDRSNEG